ncbi:MAG: ABC transporter substrate-binding protein [Bdellovibrionales bacterium]
MACTGRSNSQRDVLVFCSEGSPIYFNPQLAIDGATYNASSRTVYNRLVDFRLGSTETVPSLAKSWEISNNGTEYRFILRKDIEFHKTKYFTPTRNFNSEDVLFSFQRMLDSDHPYHKVNGGDYEYFDSMGMGSLIESIVAEDDHTVVFRLKRPEAPFIANLAMDFTSILSAEYATQLEKNSKKEQIDFLPIGTGPFIFNKYVKDTLIEYSVNKNYRLSPPAKYSKLIFAITPDPDIRFNKLENKECHIVGEPNPSDLGRYSKLSYAEIVRRPGMNTGYLAINTTKKPLDNVLVRRAINHALNKRKYIEKVYLSLASEAVSVLPPMVWGHSSRKVYGYDPAKARKLLEKAGYPQGFETELWYLPVGRPYNPNGKLLAEMMKSDLAAVGIKAELVTADWAAYLDRVKKGEHMLAQLGWTGDNADPDNFLSQLLSCSAVVGGANIAHWCNENFDEMVTKARTATRIGVRARYYNEAQKIFQDEAPWVPLAHTEIFRVHLKSVKNYLLSPMGTENFHQIELK